MKGGCRAVLDEELELVCEDDGDYATLRVGTGQKTSGVPEENKVCLLNGSWLQLSSKL